MTLNHGWSTHFVIPLGAGRSDEDTLTQTSIDRMNAALEIASREVKRGSSPTMIALGDWHTTWRQDDRFINNGAMLREGYMRERSRGLNVIRVPRGFDTLTELIALRSQFPFVAGGIVVTHPEHVERVKVLIGMIFNETINLHGIAEGKSYQTDFHMSVESGDLPTGLLKKDEEIDYIRETTQYLKLKYKPNGKVPKMDFHDLDLETWRVSHADLLDRFRSIYDTHHGEGSLYRDIGSSFYVVPGQRK